MYCFFDYAKIVINITQATPGEKKEAMWYLFFQTKTKMGGGRVDWVGRMGWVDWVVGYNFGNVNLKILPLSSCE